MLTKSVPVTHVKAGEADGLAEGQFEALVSVMGNKDSYGDVVLSGAFDESLAEWAASGAPIPIIFSHGYGDVDNHVGYCLEAAEKTIGDKTGLWVKGQLDISPDPEDAKARKVAKLLKGKRIGQFSFSYDVVEGASVEKDGEHFYELRKLKLYEVGPTLIGANQETELIGAKARLDQIEQSLSDLMGEKVGAQFSAATKKTIDGAAEKLLSVVDDLRNLIAPAQDSNSKATATAPAKSEEPDAQRQEPHSGEQPDAKAKDEEPTRATPAELALLSLELDVA